MMTAVHRATFGLAFVLAALAGCTTPMNMAVNARAAVDAAVADTARPQVDRDRDADRKPAESLLFSGVKPGDSVAELIPGRGYFTRLLSGVAGPSGHVYALVPPRPQNAAADAPEPGAAIRALAADPHYANVSVEVLHLKDGAFPHPVDLVWTSQNYHDVHNVPGIDLLAFNRAVFAALKPGGIYLVLDHAAAPGAGASVTNTLHRIDPETVKAEVLAAGFNFVGRSDILANPADTHELPVFDKSLRGKTDQFLLKFRKPA